MHRRHVKAWEQKSLDLLRNLYSENAVIFNTAPPPRFSDFKTFENTIHRYFTQIQDIALFTSNIQIEIRGEVAWITSQYLLAYQRNDRLVRQNGRWTEIYHQVNDHWELTHLHSSSDPLE